MQRQDHPAGGDPIPVAFDSIGSRRGAIPAFLLLVALMAPFPLLAADRESFRALFSEANNAYQKGDLIAAEGIYRQLLEKGVDGGALYYNLGNACFKQKKLGEAIFFWEKAKRKLPGDADVRENLELANLMVVDRVEVPPDPLPMRWLNIALHRLTIHQDSWVVLLLFVSGNALFALYFIATNPRLARLARNSAFVAGLFALLFGCSLAWKIYERTHLQEGVVIEQKAEVRSGPGIDNITVFTVHEGILLRIRGESGGWYQVSLPNGWSGWLQSSFIRLL